LLLTHAGKLRGRFFHRLGNRKALLYGAGFILLGLLVSTRLPLRAKEQGKDGKDRKGDR
jgi:hypothetical protein